MLHDFITQSSAGVKELLIHYRLQVIRREYTTVWLMKLNMLSVNLSQNIYNIVQLRQKPAGINTINGVIKNMIL